MVTLARTHVERFQEIISICDYSLDIDIVLAYSFELLIGNLQVTRQSGISFVKIQFRNEQSYVQMNQTAVSLSEMLPQFTDVLELAAVTLRVLNHARMTLSQDLVQNVTKLPRHYTILLQRLA